MHLRRHGNLERTIMATPIPASSILDALPSEVSRGLFAQGRSVSLEAAFYLSFAAYFEASTHVWQTEVVGVAVFLVCAVGGLFLRSAIAVGYIMHGLWDLSHCLSGSSLAGLSITEIPLGYGIFCSTYDFIVACYLMISDTAWHESGKLDLYFWRHRL
jgi:hypothetical protein